MNKIWPKNNKEDSKSDNKLEDILNRSTETLRANSVDGTDNNTGHGELHDINLEESGSPTVNNGRMNRSMDISFDDVAVDVISDINGVTDDRNSKTEESNSQKIDYDELRARLSRSN